jgi:uncharacterized membrane protein YccC
VSGRWAGQPSPCRLAGRPAGSNNSPTGQERPRQAGRRPQQRDRAPCQRALRGAPSPRAHLLAASCWLLLLLGASLRSLLQARAHNDDDAGSTRQTYDTFIHSVSRAAPMDVRPILLQIRRTCHFQSARRPYGTRIAVGCCCFC